MYNSLSPEDNIKFESLMRDTVSVVGVRLSIYFSNRPLSSPFVKTRRDIISSNLTINRQATDSTSFNLGSCFVDTITIDVDINSGIGITGASELTNFFVEAGYGASEDDVIYVPLGWYKMRDRSCSEKNGKYTLTLQSFMSILDKDLPNTIKKAGRETTCYDWLGLLCSNVYAQWRSDGNHQHVELSPKMRDAKYLVNFPNMTLNMRVDEVTAHVTWRDVLRDIAQLNCAFATFDYNGKLILVPFSQNFETGDYVLNYGDLTQYEENLNQFKIDGVRYCYKTREYIYTSGGIYKGENFTGKYLDISDNKAMQAYKDGVEEDDTHGDDEIIKILANIFNCLASEGGREEGTLIDRGYTATPFGLTTPRPDFRLELGDWITYYASKRTTTPSKAQLMKINYTIPGTCKLNSYQSPDTSDTNASGRSAAAPSDKGLGGGGGDGKVSYINQPGQYHFNTEVS